VNDYCSGAISVTDSVVNQGTNVGSLYLAQTEYISSNDVFYKYNATTTGTAVITASTASCDIYVVVYYGQSCNLLSPYHDYYLATGYGYGSGITTSTFPILQGEVYYIAIGASAGYTTPFSFTITPTTTSRPAGDTCYNPIPIGPSGMNSAQIDGAFQDLAGYISYSDEPELFWSYTANCTGLATASLTSVLSNALQNFYDNRCSRILGSGFDQTDQTDENGNSSITFPVINGQSYIIAGGPWSCSTPTGTYSIAVSCQAVANTPTNDVCSGAQVVSTAVQFVTSNVNANNNFDSNRCPFSSVSNYNDVWVAWNATCTGTATLNTNYSDIAVVRGSCNDGLAVYCGYGATHAFSVAQGDMLWIAIGLSCSSNNIVGTITCAAVNNIPSNTLCANAVVATASQQPNNNNAVTDFATFAGNDQGSCTQYNALFFSYTFTCTGQTTFTFASLASYSLTFALYQDASCASANPIAYCESSYTYAQFNASQGDQVTFSIGNYYTAETGPFWLNISCSGSQSAPTAPTGGSTPTAPTGGSTPTAPTGGSTPTAPTAKATPTAPTAKASPTAPTAKTTPTAPTSPTTATTTKAPSSASAVGFGVATVLSVLLL